MARLKSRVPVRFAAQILAIFRELNQSGFESSSIDYRRWTIVKAGSGPATTGARLIPAW
jgi:hypothetical protein